MLSETCGNAISRTTEESLSPFELQQSIVRKEHYLDRCSIDPDCISEYNEMLAKLLIPMFDEVDAMVEESELIWCKCGLVHKITEKNVGDMMSYYETHLKSHPLSPLMMKKLIGLDRFDVIVWTRKIGFHFDLYTMGHVAELGNLRMFKYLYKLGCVVNEYTFQSAIKGGNNQIISFLIKSKCNYNIFVLVEAYKIGNYNLLMMLLKNLNWNRYGLDTEELMRMVEKLANN